MKMNDDFKFKTLIEARADGYIELPVWDLSCGRGDGKALRPTSHPYMKSFNLDDILECLNVDELSEYSGDVPLVRPETEFCILYENAPRGKKANYVAARKEDVIAFIKDAFTQYEHDRNIWDEIFEKAKSEFNKKTRR